MSELMKKYAAKLMWQYRVSKGRESKRKRVCEERIVTFDAPDAETACKKVVKHARGEDFWWWLDQERKVKARFEFVGVLDLIELDDFGDEKEFQEVWYDLRDRMTPMERKTEIIPSKKDLREFDDERHLKRGRVKLKW